MNLYTGPEPYKRRILYRWTVPCSEFIQLARPLSKSAKLSVPEVLSSILSYHKIKNSFNQIKYNGFFQIRSSGEVQIFLGMISACVSCQPVSSCSQLQPVHWAITHWQHRHHEPRIRALSLAEPGVFTPPPPHSTAANFSYRGQIVNPRRCSRTLCCIMFIFRSRHAPPRFPQPDLVSFQCCKLVSTVNLL